MVETPDVDRQRPQDPERQELHGLYHVEGEDVKLNAEHWSLVFGKVGV